MEQVANKEPKSATDLVRSIFSSMFEPIAMFLNRLGVKPNAVTISGLVGHFIAAYLVAIGQISWGGVVLLLMAPADFLDGMMARLCGESSSFGAFLDSVTDRYSEFVIMGGLLIYFLHQQDWSACILAYLAVSGSILVSYTRSRAETLGFTAKIGILTRFERYVILIPGLILRIPVISLWIIAILANITALQRIYYVWRQAHHHIKEKSS